MLSWTNGLDYTLPMALFKCPSCQREVSNKAAACPGCGHQFKYAGGLNLKDPVHILGILAILVLVALVIFASASTN